MKLIPINSLKMSPKDSTNGSLSDVLQSPPVKRLFSQPNLVIKAIPIGNNDSTSKDSTRTTPRILKKSDKSLFKPEAPTISITCSRVNENEDCTLLPSKLDGKSEITLVPLKREQKTCGHAEQCENVVCDVVIQQYVDTEGVSPMLAMNIDEDEISAPVSKHCSNEKCDALSIDHDRCRRGLIKLHDCMKKQCCDICGVTFKTRKNRVCHRVCVRKDVYRHNQHDGAQVLKERMREREIQMVEAAKAKRNDYSDPLTGFSRAFETLKRNDELIIIPKTCQQQQQQQTQQQHSATNNRVASDQQTQPSVIGKLVPVVLPRQSSILGKRAAPVEPAVHQPAVKQPNISGEIIGVKGPLIAPKVQNPPILNVTSIMQPVTISNIGNWLSQAQIVPNPIQPKPVLTPFRMVPITNLITQPSLLHQTQGVPRFCIVADNSMNGPMFVDSQRKLEQNQIMLNSDEGLDDRGKRGKKTKRKKKRARRTTYRCTYCSKPFITSWYFKTHLKKHLNAPKCKDCGEAFNTREDQAVHKCKKAPKQVCHNYPVQEVKTEEEEDINDYDETVEYLEDESTMKIEYLDEENHGEYLEDAENNPNAVEYLNDMDIDASEYLKAEYLEGEEPYENNQDNHADPLGNDENENEEEDADEDEDPLGDVNDTVEYLDSEMDT